MKTKTCGGTWCCIETEVWATEPYGKKPSDYMSGLYTDWLVSCHTVYQQTVNKTSSDYLNRRSDNARQQKCVFVLGPLKCTAVFYFLVWMKALPKATALSRDMLHSDGIICIN
jgi:hypothetical protein